jgi:ABC-type multidrug transport system ATPase subunit
MIEAVGLTEKKTTFAKQLSGGQKRKLSVGIAFIGLHMHTLFYHYACIV